MYLQGKGVNEEISKGKKINKISKSKIYRVRKKLERK